MFPTAASQVGVSWSPSPTGGLAPGQEPVGSPWHMGRARMAKSSFKLGNLPKGCGASWELKPHSELLNKSF